jgi:hypothetical protein
MLFENDIQTIDIQMSGSNYQVQTRRLESYLAQTARLEAWPLGTSLMLLVKPPNAQEGNAQVFHIRTLPKWAMGRRARDSLISAAEPDKPLLSVSLDFASNNNPFSFALSSASPTPM